jgi:hypothetical protein
MTSLSKIFIGTVMGASALAFSATNASATIACTGDICWHTHRAYEYPPEAHVIIHPNRWHWGAGHHYAWREHRGRGYWSGDNWVVF